MAKRNSINARLDIIINFWKKSYLLQIQSQHSRNGFVAVPFSLHKPRRGGGEEEVYSVCCTDRILDRLLRVKNRVLILLSLLFEIVRVARYI